MYDYNVLIQRITSYKKFRETAELDKSIRRPNFPEDISENLVKLFLNCENIKPGDLYSKTLQKIEVKCFSSDGPISFDPKEKWETLIVVDAKNYKKDEYFIHIINISSSNFNFKCNKLESYKDQIQQKRRPRILWKNLYNQVSKTFKILLANSAIIGTEIEFPASL